MSGHQESPWSLAELNTTQVKKIPGNTIEVLCSAAFSSPRASKQVAQPARDPGAGPPPPLLQARETNQGLSLLSGTWKWRRSPGIKYNMVKLAEERSQGSWAVSISSMGRQEVFRSGVFQNQCFSQLRLEWGGKTPDFYPGSATWKCFRYTDSHKSKTKLI